MIKRSIQRSVASDWTADALGIWMWLLILTVLCGSGLRLLNLNSMIYWGDEVYSSIRIFGYTTQKIYQAVRQTVPVTALDLQKFQQFSAQPDWHHTLHSLAIEDPHITPLYFLTAHFWARLFGSSIVSLRSFSALLGVALLPAVYWLAHILFHDRRVALCSCAIVAVSPVQLLYAQEVRMYSLWVLLVILAGGTLLRAIQRRTWASWAIFGSLVSASLYTHFLSAIPLAGYGLYTIVLHSDDRALLKRFATVTSFGIFSFCPWVWIFLTRQAVEQEDGTQQPFSLIEAAKNWFSLFRRGFIDLNTTTQTSLSTAIILFAASAFCFTVVIYSLYRLRKETDTKIWLFIGLLIFGLPLTLFGESLHGVLPSRYLLPSYVGLSFAIGHLLGTRLLVRPAKPRIWATSLVTLLTIGLISCAANVQANTWWNKGFGACNPRAAQMINQASQPLVISDGTGGPFFDHALSNIISVARLTRADVQFQIGLEPNPQPINAGTYSDRFILTPSKNLREQLQAEYGDRMQPLLTLAHPYRSSNVCLWHLTD